MKILLFNRNEQYIATLKDVLSAKHTEELNGENVLEIETLDEIEKNQRLIYKDKYGYWHEFIVKGVEEERAEEGIIRRVFAESSFYETWGDYIEDKRPYDVPANIALSVALEPTRWEVGIVDDLGLNSTNFYHISAKEAVQKVAETWQGELRYRGRYVDLLARRGHDLGKRFTYTKDLLSITKTVHRDDVITALYGYGKGQEIVDEEGQPTGGFGRRIDFADINGGKAYVENLEALAIWGRLNPDGSRSHVFGKVEFDDVEDPHELLELTKEKLKELSQPHITYEAKVIDLKALGIEHEGVELGDTVGIIDNEFEPPLRLKARVIKMVRDLLEPENTEIVLGNFIPTITDTWLEQEKYISNFRDKQGVWDRSKIINDDGAIDSQFLKNLVDELNTRMNALGGYVYLSEDGKGLITYDKPIDQNPTMAIQLLGGAFRIANSKLPNGEWNWRTFGDGNGFVADAFIGGLLKGGKVHFDLTNGTLLIGDSISDYNLLFDGSSLKIKGQLHIGSNSIFDVGYDPTEKETPDGAQTKADAAETNAKGYVDTQFNVLDGKIEARVKTGDFESYKTQAADQIAQRVQKGSIISEINQTTEIIKIQASKIALEGLVTANSNFKILTDGSIEAKNADISGRIVATHGKIGDFLLTGNVLQSTSGAYGVHLSGSSDNNFPLWIGNSSFTTPNFSVRWSGETFIRNGDIRDVYLHDASIYNANITNALDVETTSGKRRVLSRLSNGEVLVNAYNIAPLDGQGGSIGSELRRYSMIYLANNPNIGSDMRHKSYIQDIPDDLIEELKGLQPKMFQQDGKWHFGYIAQDVERVLYKYALKKVGWENAKEYVSQFEMLYKDESYLSLIYAEIAVLKEAEMQRKIDSLEERLIALEH